MNKEQKIRRKQKRDQKPYLKQQTFDITKMQKEVKRTQYKQITQILSAHQSNDEQKIQKIIQNRLNEIRKQKDDLSRIEKVLHQKNKEVLEMTIGEPTIKTIPEMRVISIRKKGTFDPTIGELIERICAIIAHPENKRKMTCTGPIMSLCYDEEYKESGNDIECAIPISGQITINDPEMEIKTYPSCKVISYIHKGAYTKLHEKYIYLFKYIQENGLQIDGPNRELYHHDPSEVPEDELKTEIQIPIKE